jgi:hypothetical protein
MGGTPRFSSRFLLRDMRRFRAADRAAVAARGDRTWGADADLENAVSECALEKGTE